uniref:Major facilitator superfamily (MFS) profile domain-containing protein n=1 Tax=Ciona savignyi TaxID=51511 RepID=H2ZAX7_CIOSA
MLRKKQYRNQFIAVNLLLSNIVMGGIDTILLYSGDIFRNAGISESNIFYINIGAFSLLFICCFVGSFLVDRFGGYRVMVAGCVVLLCSQVLFTVAQAIEHLSPAVTRPLAVVAVFLILGSWSLGINSSVFALLGEITTDRTRTTAYGYAAILFWILSWLGGFIPPYLILYARAYALAPWIIWTVMIIVYAITYLPGVREKTS